MSQAIGDPPSSELASSPRLTERRDAYIGASGIQELLRRIFEVQWGSRIAGRNSSNNASRRGAVAAYATVSLIAALLILRFFLDYTLDLILYLAWNSFFNAMKSDIDVAFVFSGAPRRQIASSLLMLLLKSSLFFVVTIKLFWGRGYGPAVMWVVRLGEGGQQESWMFLDYALAMVAADAVVRTFFLVVKTCVAVIVCGVFAVVATGPIQHASDIGRFIWNFRTRRNVFCMCNRSAGVGVTDTAAAEAGDNDDDDATGRRGGGLWDEERGLERSLVRNAAGIPSFGRLDVEAVRSGLTDIPASIRRRFDTGPGLTNAATAAAEARTVEEYAASTVESEVPSGLIVSYESIYAFMIRKRVDSLLEDCISLYRALLPTPLWLSYFASGPHAIISCGVLSAVKARDLYETAAYLYSSIIYLINGELEFGRRASESEIRFLLGQTCPICFDNYTSPIFLPCNHAFCEHCLQEWMLRDATCPVCRQPAVEQSDMNTISQTLNTIRAELYSSHLNSDTPPIESSDEAATSAPPGPRLSPPGGAMGRRRKRLSSLEETVLV